MTVAARSEADIDEDDIIKKVAKSSGSQYSIHKEKAKPEDREPSGPVVSTCTSNGGPGNGGWDGLNDLYGY